jgi:mevalonate kinase
MAGEPTGRAYPYLMREHPEPRPRDDKDAAQDIARDLAEIASHIGQLKGDANAYLSDPNYNTLKHRLEIAHSALEAAAVEAKGGGYG